MTVTLPRTTPEQQGIASAAVLDFVEAVEAQIHELQSFVLVRHGSIAAEGWWSPYTREQRHMVFSLSKSFTSTAVGFAVSEGYFSLDDTLLSFFPDETPADMNDHWAAMRVRDLLSMSTGQAFDSWAAMVNQTRWIAGFFEVPVLHAPGTTFLYNTGATYMLSAIVQKTTGMNVLNYLESRLFQPLGIENAAWFESPEGITAGGIGLSIKTEDIARFGQLYLQNGRWNGSQVIPETWITEATALHMTNADHPNPDWSQGYGYQFWRCRHGAYRGDGVFGQYCIVMPEQDAVLAITGGVDVFEMQKPLNLVWDILLPAMGSAPLPDDPASQRRLTEKLASLACPLVTGQPDSPTARQVSGKMYQVDANALGLEEVTLNFDDSMGSIVVKTAAGEDSIPCGFGTWIQGHTRLFAQPLLFDDALTASSGAWTADDTFTMVVRLLETPFFHTVAFYFDGMELIIESQINVSLESMAPVLLTAHRA